jgi:hypothetical protein
MTDLKDELHRKLAAQRSDLLGKLEGLGEYDLRRPLTPSGTNLLGLVKHLAGVEYVYLGDAMGRPAPELLAWNEDGSVWEGADMWATADEASADLIALYRRACEHADRTLDELDLDAPAEVPHWPEERRRTTLGVLLVRMVAETARHAGHADLVRELIDGRGGDDHDLLDDDGWRAYRDRIEDAARTAAGASVS